MIEVFVGGGAGTPNLPLTPDFLRTQAPPLGSQLTGEGTGRRSTDRSCLPVPVAVAGRIALRNHGARLHYCLVLRSSSA
ncbi:hypothetical protein HDG40_007930 [Paraburkholderia sp. JPY158]|uniref:Uncharacterized protein n=1 Tax=Paraburkholderia atlantica TaxID=2654982 RepID=A0A7W8VB41_PARAM|nr:hypothetical protein [Paraburkholderia atlantica]